MTAIRIARISDTPLDIAAHLAAVEDRAMGAVASFVGTVRDHDPEAAGTVVALEGAGASSVAKIDFGGAGTKRLLLRYSPVTKL